MTKFMYTIYRVELHLGLQDPLMGPSLRYHNVIFTCTSPSGSGRAVQVIGTISDRNGMTFDESASPPPEEIDGFHKKYVIGQIEPQDYNEMVELLRSIKPPPRQRVFDTEKLGWVKCKPDGSKYADGEEEVEYWKCTEWTV